ncbi:MAG: beta-lactamase family protein [Eubacterium sp.]|nr:beta-lactamase family protein [Eubacterium sp.]
MKFAKAASVMEHFINTKEENGASLVVTRHGIPVFTKSSGCADVEKGTPFTEDTICRIYSCTKLATGVACMMLMERGLLDVGERLEVYLPEFENPYFIRDGKKIQSPSIRIRDLLNMTSGIPYPGEGTEGIEGTNELWYRLDQSIRDGNSMSTRGFARGVAKNPLMFSAGDHWMYGASADVLGAVVEVISGMSFAEFLEKEIFRPLGMTDTAFYVPKEKRDRLGVLYDSAGENPTRPDQVNLCIYDFEELPAFQSGGAGLFSTARDYAKLGAVLSFGHSGILNRRTVDFMRENGLSPFQRTGFDWESLWGYGYGNLVRCVENRNLAGTLATEGAFGWDGWTGTYVLVDPAEELSITLFLQRANSGTTRMSRSVVNAVYGDL